MSTIANLLFPSESTSAVAYIPAGSIPTASTCVCEPQFNWAMPTGGEMSARATPASKPECFESFGPCSTTSANPAVAAKSDPARTRNRVCIIRLSLLPGSPLRLPGHQPVYFRSPPFRFKQFAIRLGSQHLVDHRRIGLPSRAFPTCPQDSSITSASIPSNPSRSLDTPS